MPSVADTLIARLQADCTAAEATERAVRAEVEVQLKEAERARAFAWRRLSALGDMARIAALEPDREVALRPIAEALHAGAHPAADDAADGPKEAPVADPIAAFRAFEAWYEADRGQPFLQVFERYMPPTPVVEF